MRSGRGEGQLENGGLNRPTDAATSHGPERPRRQPFRGGWVHRPYAEEMAYAVGSTGARPGPGTRLRGADVYEEHVEQKPTEPFHAVEVPEDNALWPTAGDSVCGEKVLVFRFYWRAVRPDQKRCPRCVRLLEERTT